MKDKIRILLEVISIWFFCIYVFLSTIIGYGFDSYSIYWFYATLLAAGIISISIIFVEWAFLDS